jgi:hypothetical protein
MSLPTAAEIAQLEFDYAVTSEILNPTAAYDGPRGPDGEHPLMKWLKPDDHDRSEKAMPTYDNRRRRTARDQLFERAGPDLDQPKPMRNGNGNDQENDMDCETVLDLIRLCLRKFEDDPEERQRFIGGLASLLAAVEHSGDNGTTYGSSFTGTGAIDRRMRGAARVNDRALAQDAALRSIHTRDFLRRFPDAAKISVRG